jgi:hypothetical protein
MRERRKFTSFLAKIKMPSSASKVALAVALAASAEAYSFAPATSSLPKRAGFGACTISSKVGNLPCMQSHESPLPIWCKREGVQNQMQAHRSSQGARIRDRA